MPVTNNRCDLLEKDNFEADNELLLCSQARSVISLCDPNAAKQLAVLMHNDKRIRTMILESVNAYADRYVDITRLLTINRIN